MTCLPIVTNNAIPTVGVKIGQCRNLRVALGRIGNTRCENQEDIAPVALRECGFPIADPLSKGALYVPGPLAAGLRSPNSPNSLASSARSSARGRFGFTVKTSDFHDARDF